MANLIECPTCGNQISENAVSCPHCGEPINTYYAYSDKFEDNYAEVDDFEDDDYEYSDDDNRPLAMVGTLPIAIICFNVYWILLGLVRFYSKAILIPTAVYTGISFVTFFLSAATANRRYKAWGVSVAALFVSIANVITGVIFLALALIVW